MHRMQELKEVGFWAGPLGSDGLPDVHTHIVPDWDPAERGVVLRYLGAFPVRTRWRGSSRCRICDARNGSVDYSDGTWLWPEGLAHYVREHAVRPPAEFVAWILAHPVSESEHGPEDPAPVACTHCQQPARRRHRCRVGDLRRRIDRLLEADLKTQDDIGELKARLEFRQREIAKLSREIDRQKDMRRTEREALVTWLDRRIEQQEEAMVPSYISGETKRVMEIEIATLRRYRGIIVEGGQRVEDPLMPRFE